MKQAILVLGPSLAMGSKTPQVVRRPTPSFQTTDSKSMALRPRAQESGTISEPADRAAE